MSQTPDPDARIAPLPYRPGGAAVTAARRPLPLLAIVLGALALVALAAGVFLWLARSVNIELTPVDARVDVDGGIGLAFGAGYLLLPGDYRMHARADGYEALDAAFVVSDAPRQTLRFALQRLPGKLSVTSEPVAAEVFIDGNPRGRTPLDGLVLAPGSHRLLLRAPRYQAHEAEVQIEGGGVEQGLRVTLLPGWAPVSLRSIPSGAEIRVDGQPMGRTPQTLELGAGGHELALRLDGYAPWRDSITVKANEPLDLAEVKLVPAAGTLSLGSTPSGASARVDGEFRGQTPLELALAPGRAHRVQLSAPGHRPAERSVELAADARERLDVTLEPILGRVALDVQPADAEVRIDGRLIAPGTNAVDLSAVAHRVEASKPGYAPWSGSVTPRPEHPQRLEIRLKSEADARAARTPARIDAKSGPAMVLIQPGAFTLGAPRGEQGRQSNEAQRPVRLTRAYYLATTETNNAQFRQFKPDHSSGIMRRETLDNERQPAARVSWDDAARYCNWLSQQEGLPVAYREEGGGMVLVQPVTTGYRLPSEAEWEWAARHLGRGSLQRYPWGSGFPPPTRSGNFADPLAEGLAPAVLAGYEDGHAAAAPVASYPANAIGLFDLGGNVAEWVHDFYDAALPISPPEAVDPFGPAGGSDRVIRGSSWLHGRLVELRTSYRAFGREPRPDVGFRVARYAE